MKKILIINAFYWPGFKSGGPQQTILNLIEGFGDKAEFFLLTHNHDFQSKIIYSEVPSDKWIKVGKTKVFYSSADKFSFNYLNEILKEFNDIYLCEPYRDHSWKILLLNLFNTTKKNIYLAPMGCFSDNAMKIKQIKKKLFWFVFNVLNLGAKITWSFSNVLEKDDAKRVLWPNNIKKYIIAEDIPKKFVDYKYLRKEVIKKTGSLRIVFLSRICPQKNLTYALDIISKVKGQIIFDIYGTLEDIIYWNKCRDLIKKLPENIVCGYHGEVKPEDVVKIFSQYDCFLFPTLGENFGHVVYESLLAGCVPILSNKTAWNVIQDRRCGFINDLSEKNDFLQSIENLKNMDESEINNMRGRLYSFARDYYQSNIYNSGYEKIVKE